MLMMFYDMIRGTLMQKKMIALNAGITLHHMLLVRFIIIVVVVCCCTCACISKAYFVLNYTHPSERDAAKTMALGEFNSQLTFL